MKALVEEVVCRRNQIMNFRKLIKNFFNTIIFVSMSIMVLLVFINAVLRYGFHSSIPESEELARYFFIWSSFLGIIAAYLKNSHVGVDILVKKLKGIPLKIIQIIGDAISIFAFSIMLVGGFGYMNVVGDAKGQATGIPMKYIAFSIIFTSACLILITIIRLVGRLIFSNRGDI